MGHLLFPSLSLVCVSADTFLLLLPGEQEVPALALPALPSPSCVCTPMSARGAAPRWPSSERAMAAWMWRAEGRGARGGRGARCGGGAGRGRRGVA